MTRSRAELVIVDARPWSDGGPLADADALAVADGRIIAIGRSAAITALAGPETEPIEQACRDASDDHEGSTPRATRRASRLGASSPFPPRVAFEASRPARPGGRSGDTTPSIDVILPEYHEEPAPGTWMPDEGSLERVG